MADWSNRSFVAAGSEVSRLLSTAAGQATRLGPNRRPTARRHLPRLPVVIPARTIRIMTPTAPPYAAIVALRHGALGIRCTRSVISALDYLPAQPEVTARWPLAHETVAQLQAWLREPTFRFDLPLAPAGSSFQQRVWKELSTIPCGETLSYGDLATRLGSAARAVGQACAANPYPIVVPCHRVVAARRGLNGGLGGFAHATQGYLLDIKRWLLDHERRLQTA